MAAMTPLLLVDTHGQTLGRCSIESGVTFEAGQSVDLGPVGYFRILGVREAAGIVLEAKAADRCELPYDLVIRRGGVEQRRALLAEHTLSVGDQLKWPPERGQAPVEHEVVAIRPASNARKSAIVIERRT
jgi:hypothetical protein